ncbi:hypothetical protein [uncultured Bacteroides sp.]|uniref:hypothetical protein n=1 Tax=uncultured Bacteroides sp. TaxID=162156 RepID=UPI002AA8D4AD|nr:hypothetical protein [uncultured Bacteroides sp.]
MKRMMITLFAIGMTAMCSTRMAAMDTNQVRQETRFLTDKMAYELKMNTAQYDDAYEINFDFIYAVRNLMNDVMSGQEWALNEYYYYLDIRNDDLRWILSDWQYRQFMQVEYFYRPIYASPKGWSLRVYLRYTNPLLFYFGLPGNYITYTGAHYRTHYNNVSFYRGRYHHTVYVGSHSVRNDKVYKTNRHSDFGSITIRSNSGKRPDNKVKDDIYTTRRSGSNSSSRGSSKSPSSNNYDSKATNQRSSGSNTTRRNSNAGAVGTTSTTTHRTGNSSVNSSSNNRSNVAPANSRKSVAPSGESSSTSRNKRSSSSVDKSGSSKSSERSGSSPSSRRR